MPALIRPAHPGDGATLQAIERAAGERFRAFGLAAVADAEPESVDVLAGYARVGRSWVAVDADGAPVAYVLVALVDEQAHIAQISVRPDHQGQGVGRALIDHVAQWARGDGRSAITLTTFATIPWNGPLYAHLGFTSIPEQEIGPELQAVRRAEALQGLDAAPRLCMRLAL